MRACEGRRRQRPQAEHAALNIPSELFSGSVHSGARQQSAKASQFEGIRNFRLAERGERNLPIDSKSLLGGRRVGVRKVKAYKKTVVRINHAHSIPIAIIRDHFGRGNRHLFTAKNEAHTSSKVRLGDRRWRSRRHQSGDHPPAFGNLDLLASAE
ncbi:MAG TPA: hypothetical protein VN709_11410 [Terriglobales bacterium]|nr:hypothetical protein [Terriglobales bacterium]